MGCLVLHREVPAYSYLCVIVPWDTSVTANPLESNISLFYLLHLPPWCIHSCSMQWWHRALAAMLSSSVGTYHSLPCPHAACEAILHTVGLHGNMASVPFLSHVKAGSAQGREAWCLHCWGRSRGMWLRSKTSAFSSAFEPWYHPAMARVWHQPWGQPCHQQTSASGHVSAPSVPHQHLASLSWWLLCLCCAGPMGLEALLLSGF